MYIVDDLDSRLDWTTVALTEISFGDHLLKIPANSQFFQTAVDFAYNGENFQVQVEAGFQPDTGKSMPASSRSIL